MPFRYPLKWTCDGPNDESLGRVDRLDRLALNDDGYRLLQSTMRGLVTWHMARNADAEQLLSDTVALYDPASHPPVYAQYLFAASLPA